MSIPQMIGLAIVIVLGLLAMLAYGTVWAEPRDYDPVPPEKDSVLIPNIDVERL